MPCLVFYLARKFHSAFARLFRDWVRDCERGVVADWRETDPSRLLLTRSSEIASWMSIIGPRGHVYHGALWATVIASVILISRESSLPVAIAHVCGDAASVPDRCEGHVACRATGQFDLRCHCNAGGLSKD